MYDFQGQVCTTKANGKKKTSMKEAVMRMHSFLMLKRNSFVCTPNIKFIFVTFKAYKTDNYIHKRCVNNYRVYSNGLILLFDVRRGELQDEKIS
jgi:hypothetical protein